MIIELFVISIFIGISIGIIGSGGSILFIPNSSGKISMNLYSLFGFLANPFYKIHLWINYFKRNFFNSRILQ